MRIHPFQRRERELDKQDFGQHLQTSGQIGLLRNIIKNTARLLEMVLLTYHLNPRMKIKVKNRLYLKKYGLSLIQEQRWLLLQ
jgi:hypothetical protein